MHAAVDHELLGQQVLVEGAPRAGVDEERTPVAVGPAAVLDILPQVNYCVAPRLPNGKRLNLGHSLFSRYATADRSRVASSSNWPRARLHRPHNIPRTLPVSWQWSMCGRNPRESRTLTLQIAQASPCSANIRSNSSIVMPYFFIKWLLRAWRSQAFGFAICHARVAADLHGLQIPLSYLDISRGCFTRPQVRHDAIRSPVCSR